MSKVTFAITTQGKAISEMIADLAKRSTAMMGDVHVAACSIIAHAVKHGDATLATHMPDRVTEALGGAWRLNALRQWFEAFGPFKWHAKDGDKPAGFKINKEKRAEMLKSLEKDEAKFLAKLIKTKSFHEFKPEAPYEAFNFQKQLAALIKKAQGKASDDARKEVGTDNFDGLDKAIELLADISTMKPAKASEKPAKASKAKAA